MWGEPQAFLYEKIIDQAITDIAKNPLSGKTDVSPYRYIRAGKHLVFYRLEQTSITIARILHSSMDFPRHLP
jgi:toxin ParE1/3/4